MCGSIVGVGDDKFKFVGGCFNYFTKGSGVGVVAYDDVGHVLVFAHDSTSIFDWKRLSQFVLCR